MNLSFTDTAALAAIALSALATYSLRVGGLLLAQWLPRSGKFKAFMEALPGTILLSLVAPGIAAAGPWGAAAALSTALCAWKTKNLFAAMAIGVVIVAVSRHL